jgi:hypothetical protein
VSTVDQRATAIYEYLRERLGQGVTRWQLLQALNLQPGSKTDTAIRRARDIATASGYHFPPAIKVKGGGDPLYRITDQAADAILPTRRMHAIARGVQRREEVGLDFMTANADQLDDVARGQLEMLQQARTVTSAAEQLADMAMARLAETMNGSQPAA